MSKTYQGRSGKIYIVDDAPLAHGGEGEIYAVNGYTDLVVKLFKPDRRTNAREEKLLKMVEYQLTPKQLQQVTWPQDVVYSRDGFAGYVMPRLNESRNLNVVYSTQGRQISLCRRVVIAYNLCAAIDTIHSINQVCGDLNPQNICVNLNLQSPSALRVTLVDTDSYHIKSEDRVYRCEVGLANYLAPEIQKKLEAGKNLIEAPLPTYTRETDLFALAVHIFSLLMNGSHPFACAKQTNQGYKHNLNVNDDKNQESVVLPQPIENIKNGFFPFHQQKEGITYPLYAPGFYAIPLSLQELFIRAFEKGYNNAYERPSADEWMRALEKLCSPESFKQCNKNHFYFNNTSFECPYCAIEKRMQTMMYYQHTGQRQAPEYKETPEYRENQSNTNQSTVQQQSQTSFIRQANPQYKNNGYLKRIVFVLGIILLCVLVFYVIFMITISIEDKQPIPAEQISTLQFTTENENILDEQTNIYYY